ncbi:RNase A-like domain-containing lipoprotein [Bacillus cereus group sp. BfR-BA-01380]|uniref:RNase A-like domain-containing lipoprotein n=1 Tax=Bacillus cereus group sp. BfR-BA-01380 TaxID=2920324 RepID=UPI001F56FE5C|nr:RNase A-like domain-containing lipoprotein [Bacillus cereus group sp. BfR-BA-01380]
MKKLWNVMISIMLMMILVLSGCSSQTKPKDNTASSIVNVSDKILDEMEGPPKNGHTLERHVGKTDEQLKERLRTDNVSAASTYYDKETATKAVKDGLKQHEKEIEKWLKESKENRLVLNTKHNFAVGKAVLKKDMRVKDGLRNTVTVLQRDKGSQLGFKIITSYPSEK